MFYLLPYSPCKHFFLDNWIPSACSIFAMQFLAILYGQRRKGSNRRAGEDTALHEFPLWVVLSSFTPIPAALLSHFKSSLRYSSLAGSSLTCINSCDQTPPVIFLNTCSSSMLQSRAQFGLHSMCWEGKHTQSPTVHYQKATTGNLLGFISITGCPVREEISSEKAKKWQKERGRERSLRKINHLHSRTLKIPRLFVEKYCTAANVV